MTYFSIIHCITMVIISSDCEYFQKGTKCRDEGDYHEAIQHFEDFACTFPVDGNYLIAECYKEMGDYNDAVLHYNKAIRKDYHVNLKISGYKSEYHYYLASCYHEMGAYSTAIKVAKSGYDTYRSRSLMAECHYALIRIDPFFVRNTHKSEYLKLTLRTLKESPTDDDAWGKLSDYWRDIKQDYKTSRILSHFDSNGYHGVIENGKVRHLTKAELQEEREKMFNMVHKEIDSLKPMFAVISRKRKTEGSTEDTDVAKKITKSNS